MSNNSILGCFSKINLLPKYCIFSNIVLTHKKKPIYSTSAGTYLNIFKKLEDTNIYIIKLPTGEHKYISGDSVVLIGRNSNFFNKYTYIGKAGININKGFKPNVRGVAMNPVDHPHGGRTKTNQPEMSPWG
jgi:large subunit ribosomal protein L2